VKNPGLRGQWWPGARVDDCFSNRIECASLTEGGWTNGVCRFLAADKGCSLRCLIILLARRDTDSDRADRQRFVLLGILSASFQRNGSAGAVGATMVSLLYPTDMLGVPLVTANAIIVYAE
jgi:hypothetical protein